MAASALRLRTGARSFSSSLATRLLPRALSPYDADPKITIQYRYPTAALDYRPYPSFAGLPAHKTITRLGIRACRYSLTGRLTKI